MLGPWATSSLAALAVFNTVVLAQTETECDPLKKSCPANPALPATFETDFANTNTNNNVAPAGWFREWCKGDITYTKGKGADFVYKDVADCDKITSEGYMLFGYVEVKLRAAPGAGIVSTLDMISDTLAEVDLEFVGSAAQTNSFQTNWYPNGGDDGAYNRGKTLDVDGAYTNFHTYAFNWTASHIDWILDGRIVRRLTPADTTGPGKFPQVPMRIKLGIWAAGDSPQKGTKEWGGGDIDRSKLPSALTVQYAKMINYSPAKEYIYTDRSGTWQSIKAVGGSVNPGLDTPIPVAPPPAPGPATNPPPPPVPKGGDHGNGGQLGPGGKGGDNHGGNRGGSFVSSSSPLTQSSPSTMLSLTSAPVPTTAANPQKPASMSPTGTPTTSAKPVQQTVNAAASISASCTQSVLSLLILGFASLLL